MPDATASDAERLVPRTGTRRRFIKGGAAAVAGLGALRAGPARGAQREIKIGYVSPRTGPLAGFGEADEFILAGLEQAKGRSRDRRQAASDQTPGDRKSTRLNSSHGYISYAVFCLKKKKNKKRINETRMLEK